MILKTEKEHKEVQQSDGYCFLFISSGSEAAGRDADSHLVDGILGESVTFSLNIQEPQKVKNIAWTSKSSVAFVKPRPQGEPPDVIVTQAAYEGRIDVIKQNYDLIIKNLRTEDAGTYKADINIEKTPTITKHYHLHIYRKLWEDKGQNFLLLWSFWCKAHHISENGSLTLFIQLYKHVSTSKGLTLVLDSTDFSYIVFPAEFVLGSSFPFLIKFQQSY